MRTRSWLLVAVLFAPQIARGDPDKVACLKSHEHGQELRIAGKWRDARAEFVACSASGCPDAIAHDCVGWIAELASKMPSVLIAARDPHGADTVTTRVRIDGVVVAQTLASTAIDLDPGEHTIALEHEGWPNATTTIVLREGERERRVDLAFHAAVVEPDHSAPPSTHTVTTKPIASYVLAAIGGAAIAAGAAVDVWGGVDYNLGCYGHCTQSQADAINARFIAGDVTWAVGLVVLTIGVVVGVLRHPATRRASLPLGVTF